MQNEITQTRLGFTRPACIYYVNTRCFHSTFTSSFWMGHATLHSPFRQRGKKTENTHTQNLHIHPHTIMHQHSTHSLTMYIYVYMCVPITGTKHTRSSANGHAHEDTQCRARSVLCGFLLKCGVYVEPVRFRWRGAIRALARSTESAVSVGVLVIYPTRVTSVRELNVQRSLGAPVLRCCMLCR